MSRLEAFGEDIWIAAGPIVEVAGFRYPTRMTVIRLASGGLFVCSPVALDPGLRAEVDALGPIVAVVSPTALHNLFLGDWRKAYPHARHLAPPGLRQRRADLVFDGDLGEDADPLWRDDIEQVLVHGNRIATEVVFFHRASGTAIFTDLIQNFPRGWFRGWRALVAHLDLMTAAEPTVPRKFRVAFSDRKAARAALARITAWPIRRVLMAHGPAVAEGGDALVRRAFAWL